MYVHDELERIHRDLKSENVLLCVEDVNSGNMLRGKVADFGLSGIERDVVCGTTAYMAPELLEKKSDSSFLIERARIQDQDDFAWICAREKTWGAPLSPRAPRVYSILAICIGRGPGPRPIETARFA